MHSSKNQVPPSGTIKAGAFKGDSTIQFDLQPIENQRLANLCGPVNQNIRQLEEFYGVKINCRSNQFEVTGDGRQLKIVKNAILTLYNVAGNEELTPTTVQLYLNDNVDLDNRSKKKAIDSDDEEKTVKNRHGKISGRGGNQHQYLEQIKNHDLTIGVSPAGTGKTYLAVSSAVEALENDLVDRLILVRPAVEAGERLGFLPGDLAQKIDPYLRPMYDAENLRVKM